MAKAKEQVKTGSKAKSEAFSAKSEQIVKDVASKAVNGKVADKKSKKVTPPSSDEESDDESAESASSEDESEDEVKTKKPVPATNGKMNGNGKAKKEEVHSSHSDTSSSSDSGESGSDSSDDEKSVAEDSDDSEESDAESEEAAPIAAAAKKVIAKAVETGKAAVNGTAKAVAKAVATSDEEDSNVSASSEDEGDEEEEEEEDDSVASASDEEDEKEETTSKKRKADVEPTASAKKAKKETPASGDDNGTKNLFVGNLSWNVDDEWLYREFQEFGEITGARVISDRDSGRSKGFGYVEFANSSDAAAALKAKKGALIDGREANVDFSTPRDNSAPKARAASRAQEYGDAKNPESDTLFVGNLSFDANEDVVGEAFGAHGSIINVRLPTDMDTGNPKGFGYVTFASVEDAKSAYENMMGAEIAGRPVRLDFATPRPDRSAGGGDRGGRGGGRGRGGFGDRGGRGGGRGGRGGFGDRGGRGGFRGGRGGSTNRGGFGDFKGSKKTF